MKTFALLCLLCCAAASSAQLADPSWIVPTYVDTCEKANTYRYIYPGSLTVDSVGNIVWLFRNRSTCRTSTNDFTVLKVTPAGLPLLSTFRSYEYPEEWYYYNEQVILYHNRGYWGGSSYVRDTARSIIVGAFNLDAGDTLWTASWYPVGKTSYTITGMTATDSAIYITANASMLISDTTYTYGYAMLMAKFDARTGKELWTTIYTQPFSQAFKGNIVVTDSFVYACGSRYSDVTPLELGTGFIGKYDATTGVLLDSLYYPSKRRLSDYIPSYIGLRDSSLIVAGLNTTTADAALFTSVVSSNDMQMRSFDAVPTGSYANLTTAALDTNGFLYISHYSYGASSYGYTIDVADCRNGCYTVHRNVMLDAPISGVSAMLPMGNSLYLSTSGYSLDTTITTLNRYDGYLVKYDVTPLAVGHHKVERTQSAQVFPNPVSTSATIISPVMLTSGELEIVDEVGRVVKQYEMLSGDSFTFNRSTLPSGMYGYRIREYGTVIASGKMMVE